VPLWLKEGRLGIANNCKYFTFKTKCGSLLLDFIGILPLCE